MNSNALWDDIIIGAGYSGLSLASLLTRQKRRVCVLEAHSLPGGCASYFKRADFHFDVGATTLSGLAHGMPINNLLRHLEISLETQKLSVPMIITLNDGTKLKRYGDAKKWLEELNEKFPNIDHRSFWNQLTKLSSRAWAMLGETWNFPPENLQEAFKLLTPSLLKQADLGLELLRPLESLLPKEYQSGPLRQLIDEQLLISTQSYADKVPALIGALGLTYPDDMYYPFGGITSLAQKLESYIVENGGKVEYSIKVKSINNKLQVISVDDQVFQAKRIISTIPIWNLRVFNPKLEEWVNSMGKVHQDSWSAITMNFAIRPKKPIENLYHQIHLDEPIKNAESNSLFFSLSKPEDKARAPTGWQTVTVSTHTFMKKFSDRKDNDYKKDKEVIANQIIKVFREKVSDFDEIKFKSVGTPHTFERYTGRYQGRVGGIAHSIEFRPWHWPSHTTPLDNFYHSGDTAFPGQGIVGVIQGSLNFMQRHHWQKEGHK
tara:strand:- start:9999 stop:11468 length:1470 start_codon:yes stop_codon:yes gene_type:complete